MACRTALLRFLAGMAIITTLLGAIAAPASARQATPDLLDLPAVALFPSDLADEGQDGFGLGYSTLLLPGEMTAKISGSANAGRSPSTSRSTLSGIGLKGAGRLKLSR